MADAIITVEDQTVIVTYSGAETVSASFVQLEALAAAADASADAAALSEAAAEAAATTTEDVRNIVLTEGYLPVGWIDPDDYTGITYRNDYDVKFYSNGLRIWTMLPDEAATLTAWRSGGVREKNPDDGLYYVSVKMGLVKDQTLQGASPTVIYVNNGSASEGVGAGNDTTGDGSITTPYKTNEKALAVLTADGVNTLFEVRTKAPVFLGGNSAGWNTGTQVIPANKSVKFIGLTTGGEKPWWLPGMRNAYTKAVFAASSMGNGIWKVTTASISVNAKNTDLLLDLSVLDADGCPTPSAYMAGPFADEAAILAAMAERPSFHNTAGNDFYYKLASGEEGDPGVNMAYVETPTGNLFSIGEGGRIQVENFRCVFNGGNSLSVGLLGFRPLTYTQGAGQPAVAHDIEAVVKDCEVYGVNSDAFRGEDVFRFVVQDCKYGLCREDGVDTSTLYTYPSNTNSITEGDANHTFIDGLIGSSHGDHEWRDQPTQTSSGNSITGHSQTWTTAINCRVRDSHGSTFAFVGGAKCLAINCNAADPQYVTPATDVYQAPYLASGNQVTVTSNGSAIYGIHCTGMVRPTGRMFYVGPTADMVQADFRGTVTKQVESGGTLVDGYGNNL